MDYIGIAIIIITVTGCIAFVSNRAYKRGIEAGKEIGIGEGRLQVLNEELIRNEYKSIEEDATVVELRNYLQKETPQIDRISKKA